LERWNLDSLASWKFDIFGKLEEGYILQRNLDTFGKLELGCIWQPKSWISLASWNLDICGKLKYGYLWKA
jgi:hypothetical protein